MSGAATATKGPARPTALAAFRGMGAGARVHTSLRWATAPFDDLAAMLAPTGRILDVGCGHGLLSLHLALRHPEVEVLGVDVDADKLVLARRAATAAGVDDRVSFREVDSTWLPAPRSVDAVVVVDVLYLLPADRAAELLGAATRAVVPGGRVLVKEMADGPRWRRRWVRAQELVSVRVTRITRADHVELHREAAIRAPLEAAGFDVTRHRLSTRSPHPHVAFLGVAPAAHGADT